MKKKVLSLCWLWSVSYLEKAEIRVEEIRVEVKSDYRPK